MPKIECRPVTSSNWPDLVQLFESRGGPHYCWCMVWRRMDTSLELTGKAAKKASLQAYVDKGLPVGLLGYIDAEPVAWCSVAPRESYKKLQDNNSLPNVWSLACFFIKKPYRGQGLTKALIVEAMAYAKAEGAQYLEAYPVDPESPSYHFMGLRPVFEKMGFEWRGPTGKRRNVMLIKL